MTEMIRMLGISKEDEINDDCVPFSGEGICPTCKHLHKVESSGVVSPSQGSYAEIISGWKPTNPDDYHTTPYYK